MRTLRISIATVWLITVSCSEQVAPTTSGDGLAPPAFIVNGEVDGTAHPYVGLLVVFGTVQELDGTVIEPNGVLWRCSGSQLTPTVFLTAGHCAAELVDDFDGDGENEILRPTRGRVFFAPTLQRPLIDQPFDGEGSLVPHPLYTGLRFPNTRDLGLVLLDRPVSLPVYAQLAPEGTLDSWSTDPRNAQALVAVGYGLQLSRPNTFRADLVRMQATAQFVTLQSAFTDGFNVQTANTPREIPEGLIADPDGVIPRAGGTCLGDSGGPQLLPGTNTVVAVTSAGSNDNCAGTGYHYRTDIAEARSFLDRYVN